MQNDFDIIIVGAGLVGTSLIIALQQTGLRIVVLENHLPDLNNKNSDNRPLSLSLSSQKILEAWDIWSSISEQAVPIQTVHISEQNHFGTLSFSAREEKLPALGYVVSFDGLQQILYQRAAQLNQVHFVSIQNLKSIREKESGVELTVSTIEGDKTFNAQLLVGADGTHSATRNLLRIEVEKVVIEETAIAMTVQAPFPHRHRAFERFTPEGILALLPLSNPLQFRLVWTLPNALENSFKLWDNAKLTAFLNKKWSSRLGMLTIVDNWQKFPLQIERSKQQVKPGVVLLGNAAHTLYPLAAQGFNLGLRDVAVLSELLTEALRENKKLGDLVLLENYINRRTKDQNWIFHLTQGINQLFGLQIPGFGHLRGLGLIATDLLPPLKHKMAKRFLGLTEYLPSFSDLT